MWNDIIYVSLLLLSIAIGPFYRKIEEPRTKQWAATLLGFALVICVSGLSVLHPIIVVLVNAAVITNLSWKYELLYLLVEIHFFSMKLFDDVRLSLTLKFYANMYFEMQNPFAGISFNLGNISNVSLELFYFPVKFLYIFHCSTSFMFTRAPHMHTSA